MSLRAGHDLSGVVTVCLLERRDAGTLWQVAEDKFRQWKGEESRREEKNGVGCQKMIFKG